jgi:hypothetical protein
MDSPTIELRRRGDDGRNREVARVKVEVEPPDRRDRDAYSSYRWTVGVSFY